MVKSRFVAALLFAVLAFALPSHAVTYFVPSDAQMVQTSDDVVVATGVTSVVQRDSRGALVTRYTLRIEDVLKGHREVGSYLVVTELGGELDGAIKYIPGAPVYEPGERYLVFTETNRDLEQTTFGMGLGQFALVEAAGQRLAVRGDIHGFDGNLEEHEERARDRQKFVEYIRAIANHQFAAENYFVDLPASESAAATRWRPQSLATRGSYLMSASGKPFRWFNPSATFVRSAPEGVNAGIDPVASISLSFSQWNGTDSDITYSAGAQDNSAVGGLASDDGKNAILLNDPNDEVSGSVAGIGGISNGGNPYTLDGEEFWRMIEVDVVMNDGAFQQNCYNSVMVHEVGHTLGFRHSNQPPAGGVSTSDAIMNSSVSCSWNGVLKQYDKDAAATVYGSGPVCTAPTVSTQPTSKSITVGNTTSLSVVAAGTSPFTYQWYLGTVNTDESTPVGTNSATLSNLSPASTTGYWVKITNSCGTVKSNVATITVNAVACTPPSISGQPSNKSVSLGSSASMSVSATGTSPFTYQWFKGNSGDTSNPIPGATSRTPSITVTETTNVWVRVTGQCGSPANSNTATITVNPCLAVVVGTPKATGSGNSWTLSITASSGAPGSLTYEWYRGSNPGSETADKVGEGSSLPVTVTSLTRYWAKVTNSCGSFKVSELVAVAPCTLPSIVTQPADRTILKGTPTTITVGEQPDTVAVQWYQGVAPDKTIPLSTGVNLQVSPQETTSYWATLTNSCGEALSRTVIVTVDDSCVAPAVTSEPGDRAIVAGAATDLTVAFTGANVTVQWYRGASPDKTNPVGTGATVSSGPLVATTSYWALLTNACGEVSTRTVVVTVSGNCSAPVVTTQPVSAQSVNIGESATLSVIASGTPVLKYEWFEGVAGVTTKPVGTDSPVFTTPTLTAGTKYWVRISNGCGSANSITAEVKVGNGRRRSARH